MNSYSNDFYAWTQDQALALSNADLSKLDLPNLIDEVLTLGRSEKRRLQSLLVVLFLHLLKKQFQPEKSTRSWDLSIRYARKDIKQCLNENPSLKHVLDELAADSYERARDQASVETGIDTSYFPKENIFDVNNLL
jgi:hypothetical protein